VKFVKSMSVLISYLRQNHLTATVIVGQVVAERETSVLSSCELDTGRYDAPLPVTKVER
jgi:hypothetical protein